MDDPSASRQSSVMPESSASSSPPTASKFHPYTTQTHRVTKGRYITSTDPRGYVPVYEYPLNNQWIMMDVDDGFVLWTGIWKALGNSKADIVKMVEAQPELASQIRRVRGGYLKIQGTWLPYEVALRLARRVAWPIRHDLVPLFGPTFPDTCLAPDQPGYGQVIPSSGRKGKRSKYTTTPAATTASTPIAGSENNTSSDSTAYRSHPYSPSSVTSTESPYDSASPAAGAAGYEGGQQQQPYYQGYYQAMPTSAPGPGTASQSGYGGRQYQEYSYGEEADLSRNPSSSSSSRHRYAPYPPSSRSPGPPAQPLATPRQDQYTAAQLPSTSSTPPPQRSRHRSPVRDTRYDLPPISTIDLPRPAQQQPPSLPQGFSLPPITSLQGGDKPDMDASAVLRRLRLDEPADVPSRSREESYKPLYSGGGQQQQTPAYPPGPPTYYGDASYHVRRLEGDLPHNWSHRLDSTLFGSISRLLPPRNQGASERVEGIPLRPLRRSHYLGQPQLALNPKFAMKFSNSLKFNAVSDWWDEYIAYSALKKKIYDIAAQTEAGDGHHGDVERAGLLAGQHVSGNDIFIPLLDRELEKIVNFYTHQEKEVLDELEEVRQLVEQTEEQGLVDEPYRDEDGTDEDEDDDDDETTNRSVSRDLSKQRRRKASSASDGGRIPDRRSSAGSYDYDIEASVPTLNRRRANSSAGWESTTRDAPKTPLEQVFRFMGVTSDEPETIWTARTNYALDTRMLFKRRITTLYISATSLRSYVELNQTGFRKVLKKYEKVTMNTLKDSYMHGKIELAYPFQNETKDRLSQAVSDIIQLYARCVTRGSTSAATKQLKIHQREQIVWERDTVWRQMIGRERRGESDGQVKALGGTIDTKEEPLLAVPTPVGRFTITSKGLSLVAALVVFGVLLTFPMVEGEAANRCFAILCFATVLWATEAIPLFVTSMMIPLLVVMLRVVKTADGSERLSPKDATKFVFSIMFSPTIMLLIGGFTIASALSKANIDRILITRVLSLAGTRPSIVLLAFMLVSCFASMWISNVAAPTLCFTLVRPILANLPAGSRFAPCVILGIALAANIGGQSSPISSPQNLIALQEMDPSLDWLGWFAVALPVSGVSIILIWLLLLASFNPGKTIDGEDLTIKPIRPTRERFSAKQYYVSFVCVMTIGLWCFEHKLEYLVGDMGIIAIIPILAFFGTGVLKKADFDQFLWTVVFLAMGGIALGKAVVSSGLLETMDVVIREMVHGLSMYSVVLLLSFIVLVVSTFISHTIASVLLVPIAKEVGTNLPGSPARLLIFVTGLAASTGMGLPVSGFPNQTAASQEDEVGNLYLTTGDFIKNGVPASILAATVVATVGYLLMRATGI